MRRFARSMLALPAASRSAGDPAGNRGPPAARRRPHRAGRRDRRTRRDGPRGGVPSTCVRTTCARRARGRGGRGRGRAGHARILEVGALPSQLHAAATSCANAWPIRRRAPSPRLRAAVRAARPYQLDRAAVDAYRPIAANNGRMRALAETAFDGDMAAPALGAAVGCPTSAAGSAPARRWSSRLGRWSPMPSRRSCRTRPSAGWAWARHPRLLDRPTTRRSSSARSRAGPPVSARCFSSAPRRASPRPPTPPHPSHLRALPDHASQRSAAMRLLEPLAGRFRRAGAGRARSYLGLGRTGLARPETGAGNDELDRGRTAVAGRQGGWAAHVGKLVAVAGADRLSGSATEAEILGHLADVALGSPATCALRALSRVGLGCRSMHPRCCRPLLSIGMGFRTLFNQPESQALLRGADDGRYWQAILRFCAENDCRPCSMNMSMSCSKPRACRATRPRRW